MGGGYNQLAALRRYLPVLAAVPYGRGFFLVGSLAEGRAGSSSDIDLVIRARKNRVWLNRVLLLIVLTLVGLRRNRKKRAGRFCLNASFVSDELHDETIAKIHPVSWPLAGGGRAPRMIRGAFENALELTLVAPVLDRLAQWALSSYVHARFSRIKSNPKAILRLERNLVAYYPSKTAVR